MPFEHRINELSKQLANCTDDDKAAKANELRQSEFREVAAELHKLIDEQAQALNGKLKRQDARDYIERKNRINALLQRLAQANTVEADEKYTVPATDNCKKTPSDKAKA